MITASLGNIHELILQALSEDQSSCLEITDSIIRLNKFSEMMLKGASPLMERLATLVDTMSIPGLQWKYRCAQIASPLISADAEVWINEGVEYFNTVQCPIKEGD
jgi:hypothetical protein